MGYACPACDDPQADAAHLANHLAFTAMLRGGDHETWLDEHVPEWGDLNERGLADRVVDHADEREFPQVFEDTTPGADGSGEDRPSGVDTPRTLGPDPDRLDEEARAALEAAQRMTRERRDQSETE